MLAFSTRALTSILAVLGTANAHMVMKSPVPYGKSTLNNSPLAGDGSDFPCKQRSGVYDPEGASNVLVKGASNTLSFTGSAVHGGGSCQVSLTTDLEPTKDSKWFVIKSIEGGCPADVAGNLPADPNGSGAASFQYTVPDSVPDGQYTIAWSWVNKIGNREFYMNCGPATIQSPAQKRYMPTPKTSPNKRQNGLSSLPEMFVANLGNGCTTPDSKDILFPNPGQDVQKSSDGAFADPVGSCGSSNVAVGNPSGAVPASPSSAASGPASGPASSVASFGVPSASSAPGTAPSAAAGQPSRSVGGGQPTVNPGVFATGAASQSGATSAATETAVVSSPPAASAAASKPGAASAAAGTATVSPLPVASTAASPPAPAATGTSSTPPTSAVGAESGPCDQEGAWACSSDGSSFQRCASGEWSSSMAMASGLTCTPGVSSNISMKVIDSPGIKHSMARRRRSVHRRHLEDSFS